MSWDKLKHFYEVARAGSFTKAAERLHISQSALSKSIGDLEYYYKTPLLIRHSRGVTLTPEGEALFKHVHNMISEIETAKSKIDLMKEKEAGYLRVATTFGFASTVAYQHLCNFQKLYPKIRLDLICNDQNLDLSIREADIALRPKPENDPNLEYHYLSTRYSKLYASQEYLQNFGVPETEQDLDNHRLILFDNPNHTYPYAHTNWLLTVGAPLNHIRKPYLMVNSTECLYQAAINGLGIIALSQDSILLKDSRLINILPSLESDRNDMYVVYHKQQANSGLIILLRDYLLEVFKSAENNSIIKE